MRKRFTKFLSLFLLCFVLTTSTGCFDKSTQYGDCIGAFDERRPDLVYRLSVWNAVNGIFWAELFFVPTAVWIADYTFCPEKKKQPYHFPKLEQTPPIVGTLPDTVPLADMK